MCGRTEIFNIVNQLKTSPNRIFYSINMTHRGTYKYLLSLGVLCGGGVPRFFGIIIEPGTTLWSNIEIFI